MVHLHRAPPVGRCTAAVGWAFNKQKIVTVVTLNVIHDAEAQIFDPFVLGFSYEES